MNKLFSILACAFLLFNSSGCVKDAASPACTPRSPQSEQGLMAAYAADNGISYTVDPSSGIFYQVINPGSGPAPTPTSKVYVTYTGKLTANGVVIDSQTDPSKTGWVLHTLIAGWQYGIPLISEGGTIKLIVPSSLAYGCAGYGNVPPDAVLYFEITLVDIQ